MKPNQAEPELCHNFQTQVHFENNSDGSNNVCSLNVRTSKAKILKQVEYESPFFHINFYLSAMKYAISSRNWMVFYNFKNLENVFHENYSTW